MLRAERVVRFVACRRCSGLRRERCSGCEGQGFHTRTTRRMRFDGRPEYVAERSPCGPCYGIGYVLCTGCGGKGQVIR